MTGYVTGIESGVLSYLLNSLWQIPILYLAGWLAARLMRRVSAYAEHRVWTAALLLQVLLPACALPPLKWMWLRLFSGEEAATGTERVTVIMGAGTVGNSLNLPAELLSVIAVLYCGVCAYFVMRFVWRWLDLRRVCRKATEVSLAGEAARSWSRCSERFGVRGASIALSSRIFGPVTTGVVRKVVLLPVGMLADLKETEIEAILAHEFAHIRRNDFLKNVLHELLSVPLSYHPIYWLTRARVMESREMVCDEMAGELCGRKRYASSLLRLAALLVDKKPAAIGHAIGIFDANLFERRVMKLTGKQSAIGGVWRVAAMGACVVLGMATCCAVLGLSMNVNAQATSDGNGQDQTSKRIVVTPGEMEGNVLKKVAPIYPADAKKNRVQGKVVLHAVIRKDGEVTDIDVISGPEMLRKSAVDAVKQWTYKPYLLNGEPVEVETKINITYSLADGKSKMPPPPSE